MGWAPEWGCGTWASCQPCTVTKAQEMGRPVLFTQILCLWIHLLTKVCGLDINPRGASAVVCRWHSVCRTQALWGHLVRLEAQLWPLSVEQPWAAHQTLAHLAFSFAK